MDGIIQGLEPIESVYTQPSQENGLGWGQQLPDARRSRDRSQLNEDRLARIKRPIHNEEEGEASHRDRLLNSGGNIQSAFVSESSNIESLVFFLQMSDISDVVLVCDVTRALRLRHLRLRTLEHLPFLQSCTPLLLICFYLGSCHS